MKKFRYKARDKGGKVVTGEVEAPTIEAAARLVRKRGLVVVRLSPSRGRIPFISSIKGRISAGDLAIFTRQLSTMINAGLPIVESLSILRLQSKSALEQVISQILADVEGGESMSVALAKHPKVFNPTYIALIKAGETGGVLD